LVVFLIDLESSKTKIFWPSYIFYQIKEKKDRAPFECWINEIKGLAIYKVIRP